MSGQTIEDFLIKGRHNVISVELVALVTLDEMAKAVCSEVDGLGSATFYQG